MEILIQQRLKEILFKIRNRRLEKEFTQTYVAEKLGIGQVAYHKLERNKTKLNLAMLLKLAIILEVEATYFLKN